MKSVAIISYISNHLCQKCGANTSDVFKVIDLNTYNEHVIGNVADCMCDVDNATNYESLLEELINYINNYYGININIPLYTTYDVFIKKIILELAKHKISCVHNIYDDYNDVSMYIDSLKFKIEYDDGDYIDHDYIEQVRCNISYYEYIKSKQSITQNLSSNVFSLDNAELKEYVSSYEKNNKNLGDKIKIKNNIHTITQLDVGYENNVYLCILDHSIFYLCNN